MKSLLLFYLLSALSIVYGQDLSTDNIVSLPTGGWRFTFPTGCTDDCRIIEWIPVLSNGEDMLRITLSGTGDGYVAVAFSLDQLMGELDDAYICSLTSAESSTFSIKSAILLLQGPPLLGDPINDTNIISTNKSDGRITCIFNRPINVTKRFFDNSASFNLAETNFHLLYAEGSLAQFGFIARHSYRRSTTTAINFLNAARMPTPDSTTEPEEEIDDFAPLSSSGGWRFTFPTGCTDDCRTIEWIPVLSNGEDMLRITLSGTGNGYVAVAFSLDQLMGESDDAYICSLINPESSTLNVNSGYLFARAPPVTVGMVAETSIISYDVSNGKITCTFERPISVTKLVFGNPETWNLGNTNFYLLYAEGSVQQTGAISYHSFRHFTPNSINFLNFNMTQQTDSPTVIPEQVNSTQPTLSEAFIVSASNGGGIWKFPPDCTNDCRSINWKPENINGTAMVKVTIKGNDVGYNGLSFTQDTSPDTECYFCIAVQSNNISVLTGTCAVGVRPVIEKLPANLVINTNVSEGILTCSFLRPIRLERTSNEMTRVSDLSIDNFTLTYAEGPLTSSGDPYFPSFISVTEKPFILVNLSAFNESLLLEATTQPPTVVTMDIGNLEEITTSKVPITLTSLPLLVVLGLSAILLPLVSSL